LSLVDRDRESGTNQPQGAVVDFIEMAKQIELEGIEHYRTLAKECQVKELAGIFEYFVRQEQNHYELFDAWGKNRHLPEPSDRDDVVRRAKGVFSELAKDMENLGVPAIDHDDAYDKALSLEENSVSFYRQALEITEDPKRKDELTFVLHQEVRHLRLVESLMQFQRHPHEWLENAEWYHFDEF
jgi:rubrerythrin